MDDSSLRVAVRLRPFNERERNRNAKLIISMQGSTTTIVDPEGRYPEKKFTFDFSYWSHDGYKERDDGYLEPADARYADQVKVFEDLGRGVLENAWKGFNCSLFAYGQTGSGKSYSMVGYNQNKGIIPTACEALFQGIDERKKMDDVAREAEYQVSVSMLEIYNETVKDLLNVSSFKKGGLRVREHPTKGFYVEQLVLAPVSDYAGIEGRIAEGTRNRTLAATNMNATSSRAHTIVAINFVQKGKNDVGQNMTKTSIINLVDLAGSERADSTGATGERLKEGSMINKSLMCLGNCIKALSDIQGGQKVKVPFRDSVLTRLLKNALGGNSKTIMIAALSPADINYDETLSTLRFADRAKAIKTKAIVNESPTEKLIREMKGEINRLQDLLKSQASGTVVVQGISEEEVEELKKQQEAELLRNQQEISNMERTWQQRLEQQKLENEKMLMDERNRQEARKTIPHLWNLNEDPVLTGMVVHFTPPGSSSVGNSEPATIVLKGLSILKDHAHISNAENSLIHLVPDVSGSKVLVNGKEVVEKTELHHNDRVMFGSNHLYVFHHPQDAAKRIREGEQVEKVSFDSAQEEIAQNKGFDMGKAGKSKEDMILQEDLIQVMPMLNEANAMSEELDMKMLYEIALISPQARGLSEGRTEVHVKAKNLVNGNEFLWDKNQFIDRKYAMQEIYQKWIEDEEAGDAATAIEKGYPFQTTDDADVLIGTCYLYMQSLSYLMDMTDELAVRTYRGEEVGMASVEVQPLDSSGAPLVDECVDEPNDLLGNKLTFKIIVHKIRGILPKFKQVWCRYRYYTDQDWSVSEKVAASANLQLNYAKVFSAERVTQELLNEFENSPITIQVWGRQKHEVTDKKREKLTTKELLALEDGVVTYKPTKKPVAASDDVTGTEMTSRVAELEKREADAREIAVKLEKANTQLRKSDEENKSKLSRIESKLELIARIVREAKSRGESTILVARVEHILTTGEDMSADIVEKITKSIKQQNNQKVDTSSNSNGSAPQNHVTKPIPPIVAQTPTPTPPSIVTQTPAPAPAARQPVPSQPPPAQPQKSPNSLKPSPNPSPLSTPSVTPTITPKTTPRGSLKSRRRASNQPRKIEKSSVCQIL